MVFRSKIAQINGGSLLLVPFLTGVAVAQTGNCVISGGINNGIQIQNCPIVQAAPTPTFHVVQEFPLETNSDGTFTRSLLISWMPLTSQTIWWSSPRGRLLPI